MDSMNKKIAYLLLLLMLIPVGSFAKEKRTFEIKDGHFYVNGKVTPILSGEMHYPRIPHQYLAASPSDDASDGLEYGRYLCLLEPARDGTG